MKKVLFTALLLCGVGVAFSQNINKREVPTAVMRSYVSQNSRGALDSVWSRTTVTIYKVNYLDEGKRYEAQYFEDGGWIKTFTEIPQVELLPGIVKQISELYPGHKVAKAYIELNNDGKFYTVDLEKGADKITIYFLMSGKFVK